MSTIFVRNLEIGAGMPKIAVSIWGTTKEEILLEAKDIVAAKADIVEWRADRFQYTSTGELIETLKELRAQVGNMPLLFTLRTVNEGGHKDIPPLQYAQLIQKVVETGHIDIIDVEIFIDVYDSWNSVAELDTIERNNKHQYTDNIIEHAKKYNTVVLGSNHNFNNTPTKEEIISRLSEIQHYDVDIAKIAVMAHNKEDVLTLMAASIEMAEEGNHKPILTIAMGAVGKLSRICGEFSGSDITFASIGHPSAPGQIEIEELKALLKLLHQQT